MRRRSTELDLGKYDTDKIANGYLPYYDPFLESLIDRSVRLLELGVFRGGSLHLWRDYFPNGLITGIDIKLPPDVAQGERIRTFEGSQANATFLSDVAETVAPEGFDIIIDDASHVAAQSVFGFWHLFDNHLKPGGLYVIEDWGTGYWSDWPDGASALPKSVSFFDRLRRRLLHDDREFRSHQFGMVGWIKQLMDEQGATDLSRAAHRNPPGRKSKFHSMTITPSIVFITKAHGPQ